VDKKDLIDIRLELIRLCMESGSVNIAENPTVQAEKLYDWVTMPMKHNPKKGVPKVIET
tara:strand:+ start:141 stop:317 length:177 start_codon:yes stop_codon:yes gene_type:complete